jgi:hypothetical protein
MRALAKAYAIVMAFALAYAWWIEITLRNSNREHLLGEMLLAFASFPASLTLNVLYDGWKDLATQPFAQLAWLSACGVVQVAVLLFVARFIAGLELADNKYWRRFWS